MGMCSGKVIPDGGNSINKGIGKAFSNKTIIRYYVFNIYCVLATVQKVLYGYSSLCLKIT